MSGTDIFLSYARADRTPARMFAEAFIDEGFSVWWDAVLQAGQTFDEVIEQRLRDAGAVVVLWSPRSVASRWVRAEATQADRRNKLAPAIIEPCDRPIIFELTHAADLCEWTGDITDIRWRTFMDDVRRLVDRAHEHEVAAPARAVARPQRSRTSDVEELHRRVPPSRQPLRPGNEDVILARRTQREPLVSHPRGSELPQPRAADADAQGEVHCLEVESAELTPDLITVDSSGVKIGRTAPSEIVLPHKSISREHCIVGLANDELLVTDLNSTNGTYIDEARVTRATILPVGSALRLGQISLRHTIYTRAEAEQRRDESLQEGRLAATS
jgi:hypothetical protein